MAAFALVNRRRVMFMPVDRRRATLSWVYQGATVGRVNH